MDKRDLPIAQIKQVIERPLKRSNGIKSAPEIKRAVKAIDSATAFKTLSGLKRAVVKAHQACQMAEMDIEDMKYGDPSSIQSAPTDSPEVIKSLEAIRDASKLIQKASDLIDTAKQTMAVPTPDPTDAVAGVPGQPMNVKRR